MVPGRSHKNERLWLYICTFMRKGAQDRNRRASGEFLAYAKEQIMIVRF